MKRDRAAFLLSLALAALIGLAAGWWLRDGTSGSVERRAHQAVQRVREAFRSRSR